MDACCITAICEEFDMHRQTKRQDAFTLLELLVVIAIMTVLIGLLLPAVQKVREIAARAKCANNLKQIGLAIHHYHDIYRSFPAGYVSGVAANGDDTGPGWGWAAQILPQLEQNSLYSSIRLDKPIDDAANAGVRQTLVRTYICPNDDLPPTWTATRYDAAGNPLRQIADVASANYVGVFGPTEPGVDGDGVFFRNSKIQISDITDGTAQTLMVGERTVRLGPATWCGAVTAATMYAPQTGPQVEDGSGMVLGQANYPPGSPECELNEFAGSHGIGANFAFADGHVAFIPATIDQKVFHALATRAKGEVIPEGF
jgi:prepilin-type N-terminal cleavage/methylation domain-containing protein/prepilin-type processing-associated H-X9-DG protein